MKPLLLSLFVLMVGCGGWNPDNAAKILCISQGGVWVDGGCVFPDPCDACSDEQTCVDGKCVDPTDPCDACSPSQTCVDGKCVDPTDPCDACSPSQTCVDGECVDPCDCAPDQVCVNSACIDPECYPPPIDGIWGKHTGRGPSKETTAAMRGAMAAIGDPCGDPMTHTLHSLGSRLRYAGWCAGVAADGIAIQAKDELWEEWHPVFSGNGCWTNSGKGRYIAARPYLGEGCGHPLPPPVNKWNLAAHNGGWNATPLVYSPDGKYCLSVGYHNIGDPTTGRLFCPVRMEGSVDREACEAHAVGGHPLWSSSPDVCHGGWRDNPYLAMCFGDIDWIQVCDAKGEVCRRK